MAFGFEDQILRLRHSLRCLEYFQSNNVSLAVKICNHTFLKFVTFRDKNVLKSYGYSIGFLVIRDFHE